MTHEKKRRKSRGHPCPYKYRLFGVIKQRPACELAPVACTCVGAPARAVWRPRGVSEVPETSAATLRVATSRSASSPDPAPPRPARAVVLAPHNSRTEETTFLLVADVAGVRYASRAGESLAPEPASRLRLDSPHSPSTAVPPPSPTSAVRLGSRRSFCCAASPRVPV